MSFLDNVLLYTPSAAAAVFTTLVEERRRAVRERDWAEARLGAHELALRVEHGRARARERNAAYARRVLHREP